MTKNSISHNRTLFLEDNLPVLRGLDSDSIDLIVVDPPSKLTTQPSLVHERSPDTNFRDAWDLMVLGRSSRILDHGLLLNRVWNWDKDVHGDWMSQISEWHPPLSKLILETGEPKGAGSAFLCWMGVRVLEMHRVLNGKGSMYIHCDPLSKHLLRPMMDTIFGSMNFRSEFDWTYEYIPHENFCTKAQANKDVHHRSLRRQQKEYTESILCYVKSDSTGVAPEKFQPSLISDLLPHISDRPVCWRGIDCGPELRKSQRLYAYMIKMSSSPGDIVLDPFAGCATACVVAEQLGRQWIGIDINEKSGGAILRRLAREVSRTMPWSDIVRTTRAVPDRIDDGEPPAPDLVLKPPKPKEKRISMPEAREALAQRDGLRCLGCGYVPPYLDHLYVDHKKPRKLQGMESMGNFALLCGPCNRKKSHRLALRELQDARVEEGRMDMDWWESNGKWA